MFAKKLIVVGKGTDTAFWLGVVESDVETPQTKPFLVQWLSTFSLDHEYHQKVSSVAFSSQFFRIIIHRFLWSI